MSIKCIACTYTLYYGALISPTDVWPIRVIPSDTISIRMLNLTRIISPGRSVHQRLACYKQILSTNAVHRWITTPASRLRGLGTHLCCSWVAQEATTLLYRIISCPTQEATTLIYRIISYPTQEGTTLLYHTVL